MGGQGSGRKPMADSQERTRICTQIHAQTYKGLCKAAHDQRTSIGRVIDALWQNQVQKNTH
jgi:hypothetical protein